MPSSSPDLASPRPDAPGSGPVLVTGGNGFIGSHIVEALAAGGTAVRVVDRSPTWPGPGSAPAGVETIVGDLNDPAVAAAAVDGVSAVCHQAARVGLGVDFGDAGGYVADNDGATASLLDALWRRGFGGRFVLAGSMVVYGEGRYDCAVHGPVPAGPRLAADLAAGLFDPRCPRAGCGERLRWAAVEESAAPDPRNVYAATKLHQEHLCLLWGREATATVVSLRYHNVYGPRLPRDTPYAGVAALFRSALVAGRAPRVFEDGGQTRDFVHVRDVARANVAALRAESPPPGAYNIASGTPRTVGDLAWTLAGAIEPDLAPLVTGEWRLGDVRHIVASPERAARHLGFRAAISFEDGIRELAAEQTEAG
ncbi:NAD-dependent epimerase/dehydratase family protein [Acidiferrimicrobium sp. IK]|uniref:NAD-dependent epimerase/dehydratase family protein n=1 Tax=Acidiferrimicrobium sp. IK TaxID=2871700 RepID=UPI0021CB7D69|nr:NAD-dependent epimerase/dehydratase family protein [Acidiferrimicrobium sp. IK]MCU4184867.1 NAD-dependent epimerase/dehydratase family protein [Acidiferrimicrobium sp. IK]